MFVEAFPPMDRMLSPIVTTILSYIVVIVTPVLSCHDEIVSYVSYRISNYYIRKGKGSAWVLVNATFSSTLCFSILSTYVNDIYAFAFCKQYDEQTSLSRRLRGDQENHVNHASADPPPYVHRVSLPRGRPSPFPS